MVATAVQSSRNDAGIVQDQAVARQDVSAQIRKFVVAKSAGLTRNDQHTRTAATDRRLLGNESFRQLIIKVGYLQTLILGIESSCDETAAAVVAEGGRILSSAVASQFATHARFGGVVPELASREHLRAIVPVVRGALAEANITLAELQAIAVTAGPGLVGSLLVGITYAKALCLVRGLPLIAVNHIEGHIHSVLLEHPGIQFPAVALVVSGGHTHLFEVPAVGQYGLLGRTRDDAAGEAYDKVAKLLGYGYPGGPLIDQLAPFGDPNAVRFTFARMKGNELDFSFSGLKTAMLRWTERNDLTKEIASRKEMKAATLAEWLAVTPQRTLDVLASFQHAVIQELLRRAIAAAEQVGSNSILVAGGVASNRGLRKAAQQVGGLTFYFPAAALSTDNAVMIAAAAYPKLQRGDFADFDLRAQASLVLA